MATIPTPKGELEASLGATFRTIRRKQGVWLRDLSKALDISVNTLRWHENGARMLRTDVLVRAAGHMGVSPVDLLHGNSTQQGQSSGNNENA